MIFSPISNCAFFVVFCDETWKIGTLEEVFCFLGNIFVNFEHFWCAKKLGAHALVMAQPFIHQLWTRVLTSKQWLPYLTVDIQGVKYQRDMDHS